MTWSADISSYTNIDNGVEFRLQIPSGSLVAADVVRLAELNLVPGGVATPFVGRPVGISLLLCQRYYIKSFAQATTPAQNVGINTSTFTYTAHTAAAVVNRSPFIPFPVIMRTNPTIVTYNPGAANNQARDQNAAADCSSTATLATERGIRVVATGAAGTAVGNLLEVHYTADAEL
jgi:hypothetical protein